MTPNIITTIETIGTITKKERLVSVNFEDLVLESQHPFPGYHGTTVPDKTNPKSAFLILKSNHTDEEIIRATIQVKKDFPARFDASPGQVELQNKTLNCIRVKGLDNYTFIPEILARYKEQGILFEKGKEIKAYEGLIKINKYFLLDELNNGIYMDKENPEMGYFELENQIDWDVFEQITLDIKRNIEENNFDAALGTIYRKSGLKDVIRIFDTNVCLGECLFLREKYMSEIKKHQKNK